MINIAQVHIKISAMLKIGNRLNIMIKSLTHHKKILSIRFPIVHQIKKIVARFHMYFFLYQIMIIIVIIKVKAIIKIILIGNDREIQVLNAGSKWNN